MLALIVVPGYVSSSGTQPPSPTGQKIMFIHYNGTLRVVVIPPSRKHVECSRDSVQKISGKRLARSVNEHGGFIGLIEYIGDAANADFFEPAIVDSENLFVPPICLYEVFKRILQEFGEERALDAMEIMSLGTIVDLDGQIAVHAAHISNELKLAMADSSILATARACDGTLWTPDSDMYREKRRH